ncbi:MAG: plasmid recombination protein [Oscillospiraceae bacterium]|nr:plasmid recombination protein [Oscillospiraceae bacterium]
MSAGVCRVQKINGGAKDIAGVQIHNRRERQHSNSNPDIDFTKSGENYTLKETKLTYNKAVQERVQNGYKSQKSIRKDAVLMCEVLFTSDKAFFERLSDEQERAFFADCYKFAADRYGEENIISAVVHKDEKTPHLHLDFVPLTTDGRLSAKSVLGGKKDLQKLQDDFFAEVGRKWELERGNRADLDDPNAEKPRKHLETVELKRKTEMELAEMKKAAVIAENQLKELKGKVLSAQELKAIEGKRSLGGALKNVSWEEWQSVKATAEQSTAESTELKKENDKLQSENKKLLEDNTSLRHELTNPLSEHNQKRLRERSDARNQINLMKKVLGLDSVPVNSYDALRRELIQRGFIKPNSQNRKR